MDYKKIIGVAVAAILTIASALVGYNFKADVCGEAGPAPVEAVK